MSSTRAEELLLLSACTARLRAEHRDGATLAIDVDWDAMELELRELRMLSLLGPRILELVGEQIAPDFSRSVSASLTNGRRQGLLLAMLSEHVQGALSDAGITTAVLKGPALSEALYRDPGRRTSADIDLLVRPEQLGRAVEVVRALGYRAPADHTDRSGLPLLHFELAHERGELPNVELHWRIHWYERRFAAERLLPRDGVDAEDWRAEPADELASLLLFYARDGCASLRHAADIAAWSDMNGEQLPDGALDEAIAGYPALARAILVAGTVAERTVGLPFQRLSRHSTALDRRARTAVRLACSPLSVSDPQLYANMGLLDGLLSPAVGLRGFIRRQVVLPRGVLRSHAERTGQARLSPGGHAVRVLGRYLLALKRISSWSDRAHLDGQGGAASPSR